MSNSALKTGLRKLYKQKRAESHKDNPDAGNDLIRNFPTFIGPSSVVAGYMPIQTEIDSLPLMKELEDKGAKLCLPRINSVTKTINFHAYELDDELEKGEMGLLEPKFNAKIITPNIMLVPLLAFDNDGYRLGYGGGFYDRAIAAASEKGKLITIGLAYSSQKVDKLPVEEHDKKLDFVLTETKSFKFGG